MGRHRLGQLSKEELRTVFLMAKFRFTQPRDDENPHVEPLTGHNPIYPFFRARQVLQYLNMHPEEWHHLEPVGRNRYRLQVLANLLDLPESWNVSWFRENDLYPNSWNTDGRFRIWYENNGSRCFGRD
ncbi:hypothetical protein ACJ41O_009279 [Fusarium nematophilum]